MHAEFEDESILHCRCPRGHESLCLVQNPKYEIHYEFACLALLDGYHREAISTLAVALERFYEYYIAIVCKTRGVNQQEFDSAWKLLARQSERQIGAFLLLYLLENGRSCDFTPNKHVDLRNKITHQGYIPQYAEVISYGQMALSFIVGVIEEFERLHQTETWKMRPHLESLAKKYSGASNVTSSLVPTILSHQVWRKRSFEEGVNNLRAYRDRLYK